MGNVSAISLSNFWIFAGEETQVYKACNKVCLFLKGYSYDRRHCSTMQYPLHNRKRTASFYTDTVLRYDILSLYCIMKRTMLWTLCLHIRLESKLVQHRSIFNRPVVCSDSTPICLVLFSTKITLEAEYIECYQRTTETGLCGSQKLRTEGIQYKIMECNYLPLSNSRH